jgi:imidazolonepropionase-like amidohydrolase
MEFWQVFRTVILIEMKITYTLLLFLLRGMLLAQSTFPIQGVSFNDNTVYAFTHATIYTKHDAVLHDATMLVSNGLVKAVGANIPVPSNALVFDLKGKFIYPSFIDVFSQYGMPDMPAKAREKVQYEKGRTGIVAWNDALMPEKKAAANFKASPQMAEDLRKQGFGIANVFMPDGIMRGTSALVALGNGNENTLTLGEESTSQYSFEKGSSGQEYPSSLMGAVALIRQTLLDAEWYASGGQKIEPNLSLDAILKQQKMPAIFDCRDKYNILRAAEIADEFKREFIYKTSGNEYSIAAELARRKLQLVVPVQFPNMPDVENPYDASIVELADLRHWEQAPFNLQMLEKAGLTFCITSSDLISKNDFLSNLRSAIRCGLSEQAALKALTTQPAKVLQRNDIGKLESGSKACFFVSDKNIFHQGATIESHWILGKPYLLSTSKHHLASGIFKDNIFEVSVDVLAGKISVKTTKDSCKTDMRQLWSGFSASFPKCGSIQSMLFSFADSSKTNLTGYFTDTSGLRIYAQLKRVSLLPEVKVDSTELSSMVSEMTFPNMAFGRKNYPPAQKLLFTHATVWTNTSSGILEDTDVLIADGKIVSLGKSLASAGAIVIDAKGMHLTPGIIDEHSHIAISSGVNEGTHASSAEVRVGDVINPDDINIYRQLSGGVTAAQLLHGSANPIGGQSGIIKLKWGALPAKMKIENADGFIKFALGENVKQANWGDRYVQRFPQTRMGVEQVFTDHFGRAKAYSKSKKNAVQPFRKDLGLETLSEILEKKRFISCHSYQQGEINMLMHVADSFGFRVNTFTHILEGYKVADKMKKHGVGASSFSDWWAYKFEVMEAIPQNAALLTRMGITTAINSDDPEMARRLNQEAAKSMKYGNLSPEEALKLCTLNPARLLHLDNRMGSIQKGMDADLVLWTDDPLTLKAKARYTLIEGAILYDSEEDNKLQAACELEKKKLIQKMISLKSKGEKTIPASKNPRRHYHCDDMENYGGINQ